MSTVTPTPTSRCSPIHNLLSRTNLEIRDISRVVHSSYISQCSEVLREKAILTVGIIIRGPDANELALSPDTPTSMPFCTCSRSSYPINADELGDNGRSVTYQQRKMWENWVCGKVYFRFVCFESRDLPQAYNVLLSL